MLAVYLEDSRRERLKVREGLRREGNERDMEARLIN